jgi:hypothetical protein
MQWLRLWGEAVPLGEARCEGDACMFQDARPDSIPTFTSTRNGRRSNACLLEHARSCVPWKGRPAPLTWRHVAECALEHLADVCLMNIHFQGQAEVPDLAHDAAPVGAAGRQHHVARLAARGGGDKCTARHSTQ